MPLCKYCGKEITAEASFCPNCGAAIAVVASSTTITQRAIEPSYLKTRPLGIMIITILEGIVSFFIFISSLALLGLTAYLSTRGWGNIPVDELQRAFQQMPWASTFASIPLLTLTTTLFAVLGVILLIVAIVGFIMMWGLWTGKRWAWYITIFLQGLSAILGILSLPGSIVSIIINCGIIYYLTRPYVKTYYL